MSNESKALAITNPDDAIAARTMTEPSVRDIVERKRKIQEVMSAVMSEGEHYGKIPGCGDKPTLLKAGAEILAMTFGLAPEFEIHQTDLGNGHREYRVTCTMRTQAGRSLGQGVGLCSTMESKYRWRGGSRVCPECGKATIIKGKAEYGGGWLCFAKKGGCGAKWKEGDQAIEGQSIDRQGNPDIADQFNTVLKMAKKRAQVDATLTATGASDFLAQDLEDLPQYDRAPRENHDAVDAEYRDAPRSEPDMHGSRGWDRQAPAAKPKTPTDEADELCALVETITKATDETSVDSVRDTLERLKAEVAARGARMPKGKERDRASASYNAADKFMRGVLKKLEQGAA